MSGEEDVADWLRLTCIGIQHARQSRHELTPVLTRPAQVNLIAPVWRPEWTKRCTIRATPDLLLTNAEPELSDSRVQDAEPAANERPLRRAGKDSGTLDQISKLTDVRR